MASYREVVSKYKKECDKFDVPVETVMIYLVELTQRDRVNLYMDFESEMPFDLLKEFEEGMNRVLNHEPVQHVIGYSWFYGYKFEVNPNVLIPRPETEELVAYVLNRIDDRFKKVKQIDICDVGTGSGALAIALKKEENKLNMFASDISEKALEVAKKNAFNNGAEISFVSGDMLEPLIIAGIKLDVLVCNPPYIPYEEKLEDFVYNHEPHVALFGGEDGLKFYRSIFENCKKVLKNKSFMAFEMGYNQKEAMSELIHTILGDVQYEFINDINNKNRMLFIYFD